MAYTSINCTLNYLVRLLSDPVLTFSKESQVPLLKVELGFVRTFICWMAKCCPENGNLEDLLLQIEVVARNAVDYHKSIQSDDDKQIVKHLDKMAPILLHNINLLKPEIEEAYINVAKSSHPMPDKLVVEFINSLIDNLKDLPRSQDPTTFAVSEDIKALESKLRFLRNLVSFAATRCTNHEKMKDLSNLAEEIAIEAACLSLISLFDPKDGNQRSSISDKLAKLLRKFKPIIPEIRGIYVGVLEALSPLTAETQISDPDLASFIDSLHDNLTELQDEQPSWMASLKVNFEALHHDLTFLGSFVQDPPTQFVETDKWDDLIQGLQGELKDWGTFEVHPFKHYTEHLALKGQLTRIQDLAIKVGCTIFSYFYVNETEEHKLAGTKSALFDLVEKMELLKSEIGVPMLTLPEVNIVRIDDLGFIRNLRELLDSQAVSVNCLKRRVQAVADELEFLSSFLQKYHKHEKLKNLAANVITVAYRAEYVIDSLLVRDHTLLYHSLCLIDVVGEMKRISRDVMAFEEKMSYVAEPKVISSREVVVGLEHEKERLRDQLIRGSPPLSVIPIFGIAGLGKTTLARSLYYDGVVVSHFNIRSSVCGSKVNDPKELELAILHEVSSDNYPFNERDVGHTKDELHKSLKAKRFLILIDDLWNVAAWNYLRKLFPDSSNGSRILLTTRSYQVASSAATTEVLNLRVLTPVESWELLKERIFQQQSCPPELEEVGMNIVEACHGLPLMIVLMAGVLAQTEKDKSCWIERSDHIAGCLFQIHEREYWGIPDYLRQCFLYFGAFPFDEEIRVSKLIRLWTAEGFIQQTELKSLEDVAMDYLQDLIGRNLVMICRRSSAGGLKSCKIHDRMSNYCLVKANRENFFQLMERYGEVSTTHVGIDHGADSIYSNIPNSVTCEHRRLIISSNWWDNTPSEVSGPLVRSLLLTGEKSNFSRSDVSFLYQNFKLLRVLDLGAVNVGSAFPVGLENMVLLRYLAVRGEMTSIPSSIGSLQQLETFVTIGLRGEVAIPDEIWTLTKLRHLHVDPSSFGAPEHGQELSKELPNLRTLSTPSLSYGIDSLNILRRLPSLKELKCIVLESPDSTTKMELLGNLDCLSELESLKLICHAAVPKSCEFWFPSGLRKLTLSGFLQGKEFDMIRGLPNLECLKFC